MAYLALIIAITLLAALLLYLILTDEKMTKEVSSLPDTNVLKNIDEIIDDRTAIGAARARIKPSEGSIGDFTDFDPHDFERENHLEGASLDSTSLETPDSFIKPA